MRRNFIGIWTAQVLAIVFAGTLVVACAKDTTSSYEPPAVKKYTPKYTYEAPSGPKKGSKSDSPTETPKAKADTIVDLYVKDYKLKTVDGKAAGAFDFVGTLVAYNKDDKTIQRCTVSHLKRGLLITNGHCAEYWMDGSEMRVVHWDTSGQVKRIPIASVERRVKTDQIDVMLLKISEDNAAEWNVFTGKTSETKRKMGNKLGDSPVKITVLAMNQMDGGTGADYSILTPKACLATPRTPQETQGKDKNGMIRFLETKKPEQNLYYDTCSQGGTIPGNSGSLIIDEKGDAIGVHHSGSHVEMYKNRVDELTMVGASGKETTWNLGDFKALPASGPKEYDPKGYVSGSGNAFDFVIQHFSL